MTTDTPAAIAAATIPEATDHEAVDSRWFATALTVLFTAAAVLVISFVAAVSGLV